MELGEHWFEYFYRLEKLCEKTLDNDEENIILNKCDTTTNYIKIHIGRHHYLISNSYIKYAQAYKPFIKVDIDKIIEKLKVNEDLIGIKEFKIIKISDKLEKIHLEELLKIVSNWEKSYLNYLIKDGLHWEIKVVYDNIDFYTYGVNKFPDNWDKLSTFLESILQNKENQIEFLYEDNSIEKNILPEDNSINNEDLDKYVSMILNEIKDIMEYQAIDIIKDTIKYCNINKINTISRQQNQDNSLKTLEINTDNGLYYIEIDSNNIIQIIRENSLDGNIIYKGGLDALFED